MKFLSAEDVAEKLRSLNPHRDYWVMYSSLYDGFVNDPALMMTPLDDHLVHRGDGIFEACRFHDGRLFEFAAHVDRLYRSAEMISLAIPVAKQKLKDLCRLAVEASPMKTGMLRIFVTRGFGDFSANPYATRGSCLYIVTMPFKPLPTEKYERGASMIFSTIPIKPGLFAQVKSCNYLPNVLMKKESVDRGVDFAIGLTDRGEVAEGPTENLLILTQNGTLQTPPFDYTLRGTTLLRVLDLARAQAAKIGIRDVLISPLSKEDVLRAREVMMVGTTLGVLPITQVEGSPVGEGNVGPVARALNDLIANEIGT